MHDCVAVDPSSIFARNNTLLGLQIIEERRRKGYSFARLSKIGTPSSLFTKGLILNL